MLTSMRDIVASPPPPTLRELQQIRAGDPWACRQLIARWETPIKIIAANCAAKRLDLADLHQVGRIAVYQAALHYRPLGGFPFAHYAKRAIKNNVVKHAQRPQRQRRYETPLCEIDDDAQPAVAALIDGDEELVSIREWLAELGEPHRTIFELLYVERMNQREAAKHLGRSQPRVAQLHRSLLDLARAEFLD